MAAVKYVVMQPLKHDGVRYGVLDFVELEPKAGDALVASGVLQREAATLDVEQTQAQLEALAEADEQQQRDKRKHGKHGQLGGQKGGDS